MISHWRLCGLAALGSFVAALAGCGPATNSASPTQGSSAAASAPIAPAASATRPEALPPMPDPDHDPRPDRAKFDDFAAHLERQQADLAAADSDFLGSVRAAMQSGAPNNAKLVLAGYRSQIVADIAALPPAPRLTGCFAKALSLNATAEASVAAMLSARRDKADAVAAISDRPLSLPDFGGLATDIATGEGAADAKASLAAARSAVSGCRDGAATAPRRRASPGEPTLAEAPAPGAPGPAVAPQQPAPKAASAAPAPPPKKPGLFQRMFGGG